MPPASAPSPSCRTTISGRMPASVSSRPMTPAPAAISRWAPSSISMAPVSRAMVAARSLPSPSPGSTRRTSAPSRRIASSFRGLEPLGANMVAPTPRRAAARATPWPKFPVEVATTAFGMSLRPAKSASVPRPLKERIGLRVSTLSQSAQSRAASSGVWLSAGVAEKDRVDRLLRRGDFGRRDQLRHGMWSSGDLL